MWTRGDFMKWWGTFALQDQFTDIKVKPLTKNLKHLNHTIVIEWVFF